MAFRISTTSQVSAAKLAEFLGAPVQEDLTSVPGIGPANAKKLEEAGVTTTHQLFGVFLTLKNMDISMQDHCDAFFNFLKENGISSYRSGIVLCVAEKVNQMLPGTFDASEIAE